MAKFNAKINSVLIFSLILTLLQLVFSKESILFLIYLLADKVTKQNIVHDVKKIFIYQCKISKFEFFTKFLSHITIEALEIINKIDRDETET